MENNKLTISIAVYVTTRLILDYIYSPLGISIWLKFCCILLLDFMLDIIDFSEANWNHIFSQIWTNIDYYFIFANAMTNQVS